MILSLTYLVLFVAALATIYAVFYPLRKRIFHIIAMPVVIVLLVIGGALLWLESLGNKKDKS